MSGINMVNSENFDKEVLQSTVPTMVDFSSSWCAPCQRLFPILEEIAVQLEGKAKIVKLDIDESPTLASQYRVKGIPTMIVFKDGQITATQIGSLSKDGIIGLFGNLETK